MRRAAAAIALTLILAASAQPAMAAPSGGKGAAPSTLGIDISWPQCGTSVPTNQAFGIVGVNDGLANTTNPCLSDQLKWAAASKGGTAQAKVQLYVNTANPGGLNTASWPTSSTPQNPYSQACTGGDTPACAWQYGWNRASEDVDTRFAPAASAAGLSADPAAYRWWLDVELDNTWKTGGTSADQTSNRAVLEGMTAHFTSRGAKVGLYATAYQWGQIAGAVPASSNLTGLDNWRPGATTQRAAQAACAAAPLTAGGHVTLAQFVSGGIDYNVSCVG
ncbi:glycoside hydrolase family 25 domain-containing protein [Sinomonas notoginsengisoli]|uniref:hypothetical protein n=1 Tax=Sinomonas notoginsengisoli TaxID=1457311 RepID=UPI001F2CB88E|nr:hypothetical protein [Sinomonas notoginsengisoli]